MTNRENGRPRPALLAASAAAVVTAPVVAGLVAPATAAAGVEPTDPADRVIALTNAERADAGCDPVTRDASAERAADRYATQMADDGRLSHTSRDGTDFSDRMRDAGHDRPGAENIARGQDSAEEVVDGWMDSPGHRENILDCSLRTIGVGHESSGDYWVQNFGR